MLTGSEAEAGRDKTRTSSLSKWMSMSKKEGKGGACVRRRAAAVPIAVSAAVRLHAVGIHAYIRAPYGSNMSSERSAAHHCTRGKGTRAWNIVVAKRYQAGLRE